MRLPTVTIGEVVLNCTAWNPKLSQQSGFRYIDLSSVDKDQKAIIKVEHLPCLEAPSRARQLVKKGDILVATVRPNLNGVAVVDEQYDGATASTGFCVLRPRPGALNSRYLFHWVRSPKFVKSMVDVATGASYPAVSDLKVKSSRIPLPPLEEQKRIAAILDTADEMRAKRRQSIAELDKLLQSVFLDMFGDPVTNPMGWATGSLNDLVERLDGGKNIAPVDYETKYRVLKVSAVTSGTYKPTESKYLPPDFQVPDSYLVRSGDLLISRANTTELIGATAFVWETPPNMVLPDKIWKFVWKRQAKVEPLFIYQLSKQVEFRRLLGSRASGTSGSMKNIAKPKLLGLPIVLPPIALQKRFAEISQSIEEQKSLYRRQLAELDTLFASLQQRAFSGELSLNKELVPA